MFHYDAGWADRNAPDFLSSKGVTVEPDFGRGVSLRARAAISPSAFDIVRTEGLALPGVEAGTKYDGTPVLKTGGCFMAGLATHPSAEPGTLVVRAGREDRGHLLADAPEIYYLTDYYRRHPVVLVRLGRIGREALRDLLSASRRLTLPKTRARASTIARR